MSPFRRIEMTTLYRQPLDFISLAMRSVGEISIGCHEPHILRQKCSSTGGCLSVRDLALRWECSERRSALLVDRWVSTRGVILIPGAPEVLLPAFQLDLETRAPRPAIHMVLVELAEVLDPVELTEWFVTPNLWIADRLPAELLLQDPRAVVGAARADRFIARG